MDELNQQNGANYKLEVLEKYQDNDLLKRVLLMTYDKTRFTYGITMKNINTLRESKEKISLTNALDILEKEFVTRKVTGNNAINRIEEILGKLNSDDAFIFTKLLDRDQKINMGRSQINKIYKNLIIKPPYMRCGVWNDKTKKNILWSAMIQLKADGTYRAITVDNGNVSFQSRSGETSNFPELEKSFNLFPDGVYMGELLVRGESNRAIGNGQINSDKPPHDKIYAQLWDYVTLDEYSRPKDKKNKTIYANRFRALQKTLKEHQVVVSKNIELIPNHVVDSEKQALQVVSKWMKEGFEGGVIKDLNNIFLDHTSPTQCKIKLIIDADVRLIGFEEGTPGTKREKTFGAMVFKTDDGKVQGRTSGFTDKQLQDFNNRREELIGQIFTVEFNDITRARNSETYALSHPRFIEFRPDKDKTDTLERIFEMREMATGLKEIT